MRWTKWLGIAAAFNTVAACFMEWVIYCIQKDHSYGVESTGTDFGKPGALPFAISFFVYNIQFDTQDLGKAG